MDGPRAQGFLSLTGLWPRGLRYRPQGDEYEVSVTGFTFYVIWYDEHSANWLAALASPYPAAPDFSTGKRVTRFSGRFASLRIVFPCHPYAGGQNKTPRNALFINGSTVNTGYCATVEVLHRTSKWGEVRRLACPLRRFLFAAPPNCGGGKGTGFIGEPRDPRIQ